MNHSTSCFQSLISSARHILAVAILTSAGFVILAPAANFVANLLDTGSAHPKRRFLDAFRPKTLAVPTAQIAGAEQSLAGTNLLPSGGASPLSPPTNKHTPIPDLHLDPVPNGNGLPFGY